VDQICNAPGSDWPSLLLRPQAILSLYRSAPCFSTLHEVILHRDGPRADLRLELDRFADSPPRRWDAGFNRVQVVLRFDGLREIDIQRWGWQGALTDGFLERHQHGVRFVFVGADVSVNGVSADVDIQRVDGYMDESP